MPLGGDPMQEITLAYDHFVAGGDSIAERTDSNWSADQAEKGG